MKLQYPIIAVFSLIFGIYNIGWKSTLFVRNAKFLEVKGKITTFDYTQPAKTRKRKKRRYFTQKSKGHYTFKINTLKYNQKEFSDYQLYRINSDFEMWPHMKEGTSISMHVKENELENESIVYLYSFSANGNRIVDFNEKTDFDIKYFLIGLFFLIVGFLSLRAYFESIPD